LSQHRGTLTAHGESFAVALGRAGILAHKREGDGATPAGTFPLRRVFWRADRLAKPITRLPLTPICPHMGWCDEASNFRYNRQVSLPWPASAECLWRTDHLYDLILVIGHNDQPVVPGAGSAVFMHLERDDKGPTAGCIALQLSDMIKLLQMAGAETKIVVA